jgi:hypothetical protein
MLANKTTGNQTPEETELLKALLKELSEKGNELSNK